MARRLSLLIGFAAGYVLGARSGRERYDQIVAKAQQLWRDPRVQEKAGQAQHVVQEKAGEAGQAVKDKIASATSSNEGGSSDQPGTGTPTPS